MVDDTELAWLAGLLDGDGYFGISRKRGKGSVYRWYYGIVRLELTHEYACRRAKMLMGVGQFVKRGKPTARGSPVWYWLALGGNALLVCRALLPYLYIKRQQAQVIIELEQRKQRPRPRNCYTPNTELGRRKKLMFDIQRLNAPGDVANG